MSRNQILLGDAIEHMKVLEDGSIDLIVTDPPYGIDYKSNRQGLDRKHAISTGKEITVREQYFTEIENDTELPVEWLSEAHRVLRDGSALYIFCHWTKWGELSKEVEKAGFRIKNMIVLNKSNHGMGDLKGAYAPKHELVLFAVKGRHILNRDSGRKKDVLDVPVTFSGRKRLHPNEKPVSWYEIFISESSQIGDMVLDPFAGSGTCGTACEKLRRFYTLIELDEAHYETMLKRLSK